MLILIGQNSVRQSSGRRHLDRRVPAHHGGTVGVAAFGVAVDTQALLHLDLLAAGTDIGHLLGTPAEIAALPAATQDAVRDAFMAGMHLGFLLGIPTGAIALLCACLVKEPTIPTSCRRTAGLPGSTTITSRLARIVWPMSALQSQQR